MGLFGGGRQAVTVTFVVLAVRTGRIAMTKKKKRNAFTRTDQKGFFEPMTLTFLIFSVFVKFGNCFYYYSKTFSLHLVPPGYFFDGQKLLLPNLVMKYLGRGEIYTI